MKKSIFLLSKRCVSVALIMAVGILASLAADFEVDGICYNVIGDNEVEVTSPDSVKYAGEVFIPSTVVNDGMTYHVTRIGKNAFYSCKELTLVDIPEGITSIGNQAFCSCSMLENVDLPNSLVTLEDYAFYGCSSFTTFNVPRNVADIGYMTIKGCSRLQYFTCSSMNQHFKAVDGVLYSKDMTVLFIYPQGAPATTFAVPSPVARIHEYCFSSCTNLTEVTFPETLRHIEMNIFRGCKKLETCYIPDSVNYMGVTVFGTCTNLTSVHLPANLDSILSSTFSDCVNLTEVTIPRNVKFIGEYCFYGSGVKTVNIEEGSMLETLAHDAFAHSPLESIDLPNTVKTIGYQAFIECSQLKKVHMSEGLTSIGGAAFTYCPLLEEGYLPGGVTEVRNAFTHDSALKRLQIGSKDSAPGVTLIQNAGICDCPLEYLELGANVDSLAHLALVDLNNLKVLICWAAVPPRCHDYWHCFDPYPQEMTAAVYVPKASLEAYRTANEWKLFNTIVAIEDVGDINGNGMIDIADVTDLIDQLLAGEYENAPIADVNFDGTIGIADVTALIDILLNGN